MNEELRARLMGISTGTLTYQLLKRNIRNVYMRGVLPLHPLQERMVGVAYTLRFVPMREDIADLALLASTQNLAQCGWFRGTAPLASASVSPSSNWGS